MDAPEARPKIAPYRIPDAKDFLSISQPKIVAKQAATTKVTSDGPVHLIHGAPQV
jgi:hypothetical protein